MIKLQKLFIISIYAVTRVSYIFQNVPSHLGSVCWKGFLRYWFVSKIKTVVTFWARFNQYDFCLLELFIISDAFKLRILNQYFQATNQRINLVKFRVEIISLIHHSFFAPLLRSGVGLSQNELCGGIEKCHWNGKNYQN